MELKTKKIEIDDPLNDEVERLLDTLFPAEEHYPMEWLKAWAQRDMTDYFAFFDGEAFLGFYYGFHTDTMVYGLYLAIDPALQSKGYGTAIIRLLRERFGSRNIAFCVEPLDEDAPNMEQRKMRLKLYERLGFRLTGYSSRAPERYWVLSDKGEAFRNEEFEKLLLELFGGWVHPQVVKDVDTTRQYY